MRRFRHSLAVRAIALALPALTAIDISPVRWRATPIRLYHLVSIVLILAVATAAPALRRATALFWVLVTFTAFVVASVTWSIHRSDGVTVALGQCYLLVLAAAVALAVTTGLVTRAEALRSLAVGATISSLAALGEFVAAYAGSSWQIFDVTGIPWHRPAGLMSEPDWAGLIAAVGLLLAAFDSTAPRMLRRAAVTACGVAVVITAVRAVWVAVLVAAVIGLIVQGRSARQVGVRLLAAALVVGAALGVAAAVRPASVSRFSPSAVLSTNGDQGAAQGRIAVLHYIIDHRNERVWHGHGAGTLNYVTREPSVIIKYGKGGELNTGHGSANIVAANYFDLGIPGLAIMVALLVLWLRDARSVEVNHGFLIAVLAVIIDFQFNNGIRFGFVWLLLGVAMAPALVGGPAEAYARRGRALAVEPSFERS